MEDQLTLNLTSTLPSSKKRTRIETSDEEDVDRKSSPEKKKPKKSNNKQDGKL